MTHDDIPMWEDPQESSALRQLLRAGSVENSDYDVDRGLARHLAQLQAGAPLPAWAVHTTLQKSASWSVLAWLLPPAISAGVVGAWLAFQPAAPVPASLVAALPKPPATAELLPSAQQSQQAENQVSATVDPAPARAPELKRPNDEPARDMREAVEAHNIQSVSARPQRAATRALSAAGARRGRSSRADDSVNTPSAYAAGAQSGRDNSDVGSGSGVASASKSSSADAIANQLEQVEQSAAVAPAPVSPEAQEPQPAAAQDTKAKPAERRAKEGASTKVDEVSGARLEREMRMLAVAQRVLLEDPARSLRLCRQGESEFRGSMFSAERKQVALLALVQLGKVEQARREGIPFLRAFPNAPWSARLREALSAGKLPSP